MPFGPISKSLAAAAGAFTAPAPLTSVGETRLSLETMLRDALNNPTDIQFATKYQTWINQAYRDMASSLELPELEATYSLTTVASQPLYTIPAGVAYTKDAVLTDPTTYPNGGTPLRRIDLDYYRRLAEGTGYLQAWFEHNGVYVIWPAPTGAQTVVFDVRVRPTDLTADNHSPILPVELHEGIYLLARHKALRDRREWKEAALARNDYVAFLRDRIDLRAQARVGSRAGLRPARSEYDLIRTTDGLVKEPD